jgi:hypothetical protein
MPVHDMTINARCVGQVASEGTCCRECGYGCPPSHPGTLSGIAHAASCTSAEAQSVRLHAGYVACDNQECRKVLDPARVASNGAKTCDDRCRAAAWKARHNYGRHNAQAVSGRANGSQARRKPSGAQVSYRKAAAAVSEFLQTQMDWDAEDAEVEAREILKPVLSERQRKQLEDRESERGSA